jgi:2-polyprenyl-6-methoxyphenol hydroxylase-like FAD-dependent oxidoreductase
MRDFDVAILGAGAVGLIAALQTVRSGRTAIVVTRRIPRAGDPPRVDAVPAGLLALLLDLGIDPGRIGVDRLHEARVSAWETAAPSAAKAPLTAHVERPALELALLDRLVATGGVPIVRGPCGLPAQGGAAGDCWRARMVVDATGRRALTAARRQRPARPWVARTFWTPLQSCGAEPGFAIAALPDGYAYRLASRSIACLGVVGRLAIAGTPAAIEDVVRSHASWLLDGLPALAAMRPGAAGAACVQWTETGGHLRIGDAALARDPLSSQGLATGASEAMLAAAVRDDRDRALLAARQREQRQVHFVSLLQAIDRCRHADAPPRLAYRAFVARQIGTPEHSSTAALRGGRIEAVAVPGK